MARTASKKTQYQAAAEKAIRDQLKARKELVGKIGDAEEARIAGDLGVVLQTQLTVEIAKLSLQRPEAAILPHHLASLHLTDISSSA